MTPEQREKINDLGHEAYNIEDVLDGAYYADPEETDKDIIKINAQYNKALMEIRILDSQIVRLLNA